MLVTMHPVLLRGRSGWDRSVLPPDEFEARLINLKALMEERGWSAVIIVGDSASYHELCYFTQFIPMHRWAAFIYGADKAILVAGLGSTRDLPFARTQTWVEDVRYLPDFGTSVRDLLQAELQVQGTVGLVGAERLLPDEAYIQLVHALDRYHLVDASEPVRRLTYRLRPREVTALKQSVAILRQAQEALVRAHAEGANAYRALAEAELAARRSGAHDFRCLALHPQARVLAPLDHLDRGATRSGTLIAYLAVESNGYWADRLVTAGTAAGAAEAAARRALEAMLMAVRPGNTAEAVARAGLAAAAPAELRYGQGNGIGLSLSLPPMLAASSGDLLQEGAVLSLRACADSEAGSYYLSTLVLVRDREPEILI